MRDHFYNDEFREIDYIFIHFYIFLSYTYFINF